MGFRSIFYIFSTFLLFDLVPVTVCEDVTIVKIQQGRLMGKYVETVSKSSSYYTFKGIPYAEPPVGDLKFMPPKPHAGWEGTRKAFDHGEICLQHSENFDNATGAEDCLFLNVYTPTMKHKSLPVMFFIHGTHFREGSGNDKFYGPDYFMEENVVLVTLNYRLSALGFMDFENDIVTGNMGLKDIVLALKWVKTNIKDFGGDSKNVTIFGQGSGGVAVDILYLSPIAKGLFHRVILQSGTGLVAAYFLWKPRERAFSLARELKHNPTDDASLLKILKEENPGYLQTNISRTIDPDETMFRQIGVVVFSPSLSKSEKDGFITKLPEEIIESGDIPNRDIPMMIGFNSQESILHNRFYIQRPYVIKNVEKRYPYFFPLRGLYAKYDSNYRYEIEYRLKWFYFNETLDISKGTIVKEYLNYMSDEHVIPIDTSVKSYAKVSNAPVYYYRFSYDGGLNYFKAKATVPVFEKLVEPVVGASEKDELCYLFKCGVLKSKYVETHNTTEESNDLKTIRRMVRLWTNFAKTGNPTPDINDPILGDLDWEPARVGQQNFLDIDKDLSVGVNPHFDSVDFWEAMYEYYNPLATNGVLIDPVNNNTKINDEL